MNVENQRHSSLIGNKAGLQPIGRLVLAGERVKASHRCIVEELAATAMQPCRETADAVER